MSIYVPILGNNINAPTWSALFDITILNGGTNICVTYYLWVQGYFDHFVAYVRYIYMMIDWYYNFDDWPFTEIICAWNFL